MYQKTLNFFIILALGAGVSLGLREAFKPEPYVDPSVRTEPLICGTPRLQQYVDNWTVENNYVIDLSHGGIYESWYCRPLEGEMAIPTAIGRD